MYNLTSDEKTTPVIAYSSTKLIHGNLVTKKEVRVNIWLRMREMKGIIHLLDTEVSLFGGTAPKLFKFDEYFFPIERIIGFQLAQPAAEPLDYIATEGNRSMLDVNLIMGVFMIKGKALISNQTNFGTMIERSENNWFSVYDATVENPFLSQMPAIQTPLLLVNPVQVSFGL